MQPGPAGEPTFDKGLPDVAVNNLCVADESVNDTLEVKRHITSTILVTSTNILTQEKLINSVIKYHVKCIERKGKTCRSEKSEIKAQNARKNSAIQAAFGERGRETVNVSGQ